MEEIEERKASTEQIWPECTDSSRHKVVAGGGRKGAAVFGGSRAGGGITLTPHGLEDMCETRDAR